MSSKYEYVPIIIDNDWGLIEIVPGHSEKNNGLVTFSDMSLGKKEKIQSIITSLPNQNHNNIIEPNYHVDTLIGLTNNTSTLTNNNRQKTGNRPSGTVGNLSDKIILSKKNMLVGLVP